MRKDQNRQVAVFTPDEFGGVNIEEFPISSNNLSKKDRLNLLIDSLGLEDNLFSIIGQYGIVGGLGMVLGSIAYLGTIPLLMTVVGVAGAMSISAICNLDKGKKVGTMLLLTVFTVSYGLTAVHLGVINVLERNHEHLQ